MNKTDPNFRRNEIQLLFKKGVESALPENLFSKFLSLHNNNLKIKSINKPPQSFDLNVYKNIYVTGAGKASASMAKALETLLERRINEGIVVTKYGFVKDLKNIQLLEASHPVPDKNSVSAATRILDLVNNADTGDLIINLISGGASALLSLPVDGISLDDKIAATEFLLKNEVSITELNTVRKCLSKIKGGGLIADTKATVITLIISDVIGDKIEFIASGPTLFTVPDYSAAEKILNRYDSKGSIPKTVIDFIREKSKDPRRSILKRTVHHENFLIGNNDLVIDEIIRLAEEKKYFTYKVPDKISGEVRTASRKFFELIENMKVKERPICIVAGGETTVNVEGGGKGGRNQEFCLSLFERMKGIDGVTVLSGGTDGNDGPTDAAGAFIDNELISQSIKMDVDYKTYLNNNDSYNFFDKLDALVKTGPTLTNVMDIQIALLS